MNFSQFANATGLYAPALRLGVTGLSRAGKTVFITSLVRNLTDGGRLPFFTAQSQGRLNGAFLQPQPDDDIPRFDYEGHLAALNDQPPRWPDSTRQISQLRVALTFTPQSRLRYLPGTARLNLDIVDYPGEWLLDLALLDQSYDDWSAATLVALDAPPHRDAAATFAAFLQALDAGRVDAEPTAIEGARLFSDALARARAAGTGVATLGPGRFLLPGDAAGSPMLTFFPLPPGTPAGPLRSLLERRFRSYCDRIVRPFFRTHFSRLDRQIVLVDVLGALNAGPAALSELERALASVLKAFRPGTNTWLSSLFRPRIDRLLFAATKADHLHHSSHDRLEAILKLLVQRAMERATGAGATVGTVALAALRATREAEVVHGAERLPCIIGVPAAGETIDGEVYDGVRETALFPGDLPLNPSTALDPGGPWSGPGTAAFVRFRPPAMRGRPQAGHFAVPPHIRLDRALEFLIGDWLR